jgi:hypothetical protein
MTKKKSIKHRIIRPKKQSSLKWYFVGAVIGAFMLAIGWYVSTKSIDKADAYLARRRRG